MTELGKTLILLGGMLLLVGVLLIVVGKFPGGGWLRWIGRLPGDMIIQRDHFSFYFPLATCLLVSALLSLLFFLFRR
jgi:hypothetical protein